MLKTKRKEHQKAVIKILNLNEQRKQSEMISILVKKIFELLSKTIEQLSKINSKNENIDLVQFDKDVINGMKIKN